MIFTSYDLHHDAYLNVIWNLNQVAFTLILPKKKKDFKRHENHFKETGKKMLIVQVTLLLLQLSSDDAVCIIILEFLIYIIYENVETTFI